jgi:hypothetical protein
MAVISTRKTAIARATEVDPRSLCLLSIVSAPGISRPARFGPMICFDALKRTNLIREPERDIIYIRGGISTIFLN